MEPLFSSHLKSSFDLRFHILSYGIVAMSLWLWGNLYLSSLPPQPHTLVYLTPRSFRVTMRYWGRIFFTDYLGGGDNWRSIRGPFGPYRPELHRPTPEKSSCPPLIQTLATRPQVGSVTLDLVAYICIRIIGIFWWVLDGKRFHFHTWSRSHLLYLTRLVYKTILKYPRHLGVFGLMNWFWRIRISWKGLELEREGFGILGVFGL